MNVSRCLVTGNPCGTDTRPVGSHCTCFMCVRWYTSHLESRLAEVTRSRDQWAAEAGRIANERDVINGLHEEAGARLRDAESALAAEREKRVKSCPHHEYVSCWKGDGSRFCSEGCACGCHMDLGAVFAELDAARKVEDAARRLLDGLFEKKADGPILDRRSELRDALDDLDALRASTAQGGDGGG